MRWLEKSCFFSSMLHLQAICNSQMTSRQLDFENVMISTHSLVLLPCDSRDIPLWLLPERTPKWLRRQWRQSRMHSPSFGTWLHLLGWIQPAKEYCLTLALRTSKSLLLRKSTSQGSRLRQVHNWNGLTRGRSVCCAEGRNRANCRKNRNIPTNIPTLCCNCVHRTSWCLQKYGTLCSQLDWDLSQQLRRFGATKSSQFAQFCPEFGTYLR